MLILTTSNLTAGLKNKIPVSGGQKISHEIEAMCATQPASPRWRPNHEVLWHRKIAGHKPAGMTRLVCVLLSSNAISLVACVANVFLDFWRDFFLDRVKIGARPKKRKEGMRETPIIARPKKKISPKTNGNAWYAGY